MNEDESEEKDGEIIDGTRERAHQCFIRFHHFPLDSGQNQYR